ncbi:MAG: peptidylprolyl isomerase [Xanthomonadales bacterium]|nr:peptidylprolyl isomerase [Xanthomonadales bacterium]
MPRYLIAVLSLTLAAGLAAAQDEAAATYVKLATSKGDIYLELYPEQAPQSVENFLAYVDSGFYGGTIFHRVIPNFVIQGGGFTADYEKKPTRSPIENEADNGLRNERGTIAMARTADPHSGTSQFYINVTDNPALNHSGKTHSRAWGYAVFGKVISGMDVVDAIRSVPTGPGGPFRSDVPQTPITIESASRVDSLPTPPPEETEGDAAQEAETATSS